MARPKNLDFKSEWGKAAQREGSGRRGGEAEQPGLCLCAPIFVCPALQSAVHAHAHTKAQTAADSHRD